MPLAACPSCSRHARVSEPACPFCGSLAPRVPPASLPHRGPVTRALLLAGAVSLGGCMTLYGGAPEPPPEQHAEPIAPVPEPEPAAPEPPAPQPGEAAEDAPPPDTAAVPMYGGPPADVLV